MNGLTGLWPAVIAVVGTLAGHLLANLAQGRRTRVERRETRRDARQADALAAVTALVSALADHRRAMWMLEDQRLSGADEPAVAEALAEALAASHVTRSAVEAPLVTVGILAPPLARPAKEATQATYAMRNAADEPALQVLRQDALDASDRLVDAASTFFADGGVAA